MNISVREPPLGPVRVSPDSFARFAEVLAEATFLVDGNGMVLTANKPAGVLLGRRPADLINRPLTELTIDGEAAVDELIRAGSRSPQRSLGALRWRIDGGSQVKTRCEVAAVQARSADQPALVSVRLFIRHENVDRFALLNQRIEALSKEIARRREAEAKLESYSMQLIDAGRRKDEFLAMLSHELRNPLAPMKFGIDLLDSIRSNEPKVVRVSTMMRRQLGHLTRLVDDLLDIARLTHGKIELHKRPVQLDEVLGQAVEMFRSKAEEQGLHLQLDGVAAPVTIDGDPDRLVQVFGNLLSNALKFSHQGGEIVICARLADDGVTVSVRDDGVGISPELLPQVFGLFVQADRTLDRRNGGLGVGLAVVRSIVELHGGRVSAVSEGLGHGAEMRVWLPVLRDSASGLAAPPGVAGQSGASDAAAPSLRILVVEDNTDAAEVLREILIEWGHEVACVGDGQAALDLWPQFQPDVALCDIGLPGMSGHQLARKCRPLAGSRPLLMLALSGYGSAADVRTSVESGFDDHLVKPVDLDRLERMFASHAASLGNRAAG